MENIACGLKFAMTNKSYIDSMTKWEAERKCIVYHYVVYVWFLIVNSRINKIQCWRHCWVTRATSCPWQHRLQKTVVSTRFPKHLLHLMPMLGLLPVSKQHSSIYIRWHWTGPPTTKIVLFKWYENCDSQRNPCWRGSLSLSLSIHTFILSCAIQLESSVFRVHVHVHVQCSNRQSHAVYHFIPFWECIA